MKKVKITAIAVAKEFVNRLEGGDHRLRVYFGNGSVRQHDVYYHDNAGWHWYYAEGLARSTDVKDLSADDVAKALYHGRKQFNGLFFDVNEGFTDSRRIK